MLTKPLFETALNIHEPWFIKDIQFDLERKRLDIHIDFKKGSLFYYESQEGDIKDDSKAYDTQEKEWRHLNLSMNVIFMLECQESRLVRPK